jgi:hypothetical protein
MKKFPMKKKKKKRYFERIDAKTTDRFVWVHPSACAADSSLRWNKDSIF